MFSTKAENGSSKRGCCEERQESQMSKGKRGALVVNSRRREAGESKVAVTQTSEMERGEMKALTNQTQTKEENQLQKRQTSKVTIVQFLERKQNEERRSQFHTDTLIIECVMPARLNVSFDVCLCESSTHDP